MRDLRTGALSVAAIGDCREQASSIRQVRLYAGALSTQNSEAASGTESSPFLRRSSQEIIVGEVGTRALNLPGLSLKNNDQAESRCRADQPRS